MDIRAMKPEDLDAIALLYLKAYRAKWDIEGAKKYLRKFFDFEPKSCLVATQGERAVGAILGYSFEKESGPILFIQELFVDPESRNKGLGKSLVTHLRETLTPRPVEIKPLVKADTSVLNFYNSLGFEKDKVVSFSIDE
jgi:ribosomal protein S18 acetylase RimI-like enzyme